jgi:hypothetical protein
VCRQRREPPKSLRSRLDCYPCNKWFIADLVATDRRGALHFRDVLRVSEETVGPPRGGSPLPDEPGRARNASKGGKLATPILAPRSTLALPIDYPQAAAACGGAAATLRPAAPISTKNHKKRRYVLAFAECGNRSQAAEVGEVPRVRASPCP